MTILNYYISCLKWSQVYTIFHYARLNIIDERLIFSICVLLVIPIKNISTIFKIKLIIYGPNGYLISHLCQKVLHCVIRVDIVADLTK